jgi:protein phosphatase methylesterase 1
MHHGAGMSGLSFAVMAAEIRRLLPEAGILAPDARGHGATTIATATEAAAAASTFVPSDGERPALDMSLATLSADMVDVVRLVQEKLGWAQLPAIVLVGHSLGGAVVTEVAKSGALGDKVLGYAVLDVVEG